MTSQESPNQFPVEIAQNEQFTQNERFWTVPTTLMTMPRLLASAAIPYRAYRGESTASLAVFAAATDAEGFVGREIDKRWPDSGMGCSVPGAELDYGSDAALVAGTSIADIIGVKSHPLTRLAGAVTGARVVEQANWAAPMMSEYKQITGEKLRIKVGMFGKCATAATLVSAGLNAVSRDIEPTSPSREAIRKRLAVGGLVSAAVGYGFGRLALKENKSQVREKIITHNREKLMARLASQAQQ